MADSFNTKKFTVHVLHPIDVIIVSNRMARVDVRSLAISEL